MPDLIIRSSKVLNRSSVEQRRIRGSYGDNSGSLAMSTISANKQQIVSEPRQQSVLQLNNTLKRFHRSYWSHALFVICCGQGGMFTDAASAFRTRDVCRV